MDNQTMISVELPEETESKSETQTMQVNFAEKELNGKKLEKPNNSPFVDAKKLKKRLKILVFGDSGTLKTRTGLSFADVVIDTEGSSDFYGDEFNYDVIRTSEPDEILKSIQYLLTNKHDYKTLLFDSFTPYWESLQKKYNEIFMNRNQKSKGFKFEFYEFQPRDWQTLKADLKYLIRKLLMLDMNVIVTARQKAQYKDGAFMEIIGETFDGEKGLPYEFDVVLKFYIDNNGKFMVQTLKDRTGKFPKLFENRKEIFVTAFGKDNLERVSVSVKMITATQKKKIQNYLNSIKATPESVKKSLENYDANSIDELTYDNAEIIIKTLESNISAEKKVEEDFNKVMSDITKDLAKDIVS